MLKCRTLCAGLFAPALLAAGAARAAPAPPEDVRPSTDDSAQAGDSGQDEEDLNALPGEVEVITVDRFEDMGGLNLQDTLRYAAGIRTEAYGLDTRGDYGFIRGVEVPVYQDGLRRPFGFRAGSRPELFTLSRIEVLRGPASMLYGQGSVGGLLNLVTKRPQFEFGGQAFAAYGSFARKEIGVDVTGPIIDEKLAFRGIALWRDTETQTDYAGDRRNLVNLSLEWAPGPFTNLTLTGHVQDDESGWRAQFMPYALSLGAAPGEALPWGTQLGEPSADRIDLHSAWLSAQFAHQFSHVVEFRQNVRVERFRSDAVLHYVDPGPDPLNPFVQDPNISSPRLNRRLHAERYRVRAITSDSQLQFDFTTGDISHSITAGIDYAHFDNRAASVGEAVGPGYDEAPMPGASIDAYRPSYGNILSSPLTESPEQRHSQWGVYAQGQTRILDRAIAVFGVRHDRAVNQTIGAGRQVDSATTMRTGFMLDLGGGLQPYLSYSQSFLPVSGLDASRGSYRPMRGTQYEAGLKWRVDPHLLVTFAGYSLTDRNRLITDPENPFYAIQAGRIETHGVEAEATYSLPGDFEMIATYSYTRARDRENGGRQLESVPRHLASIWGSKIFPLHDDIAVQVGAGLRYVDESIVEGIGVTPFTIETPDYMLADALVAVDWGRWTLAVNASNLFDKKYYTTCLGRGDCFRGLSRTVSASVGFRF